MSEIKFRAICDFEINGELQPRAMVYFGAQEFDDGIKSWPMPCTMDKIISYESPLMQYTGRGDVNGTPVYDGDIIENCDTKLLQVVYWNEDEAAWYCQYIDDKSRVVSLADSLGNLNIVVGNIYENHEHLLNK